jgi:hypothetical protein
MYRDIYGAYHSEFTVTGNGFHVNVAVYRGSGFTDSWGLVATSYYQAPGHGKEAFDLLGEHLQSLADQNSQSVVDLFEPTTSRSKILSQTLADTNVLKRVSFNDTMFYIREFQPRNT